MKNKTKNEIPFFAIGNNDLEEKEDAGTFATCPKCKKKHRIKYGTSSELLPDGTHTKPKKSKMAGFISCGKNTYLASLNGKLL